MTPSRYRNGNQHLHRESADYRRHIKRKMRARLHSGRRRPPRSTAVSRRRCSQSCSGLIRLPAENHSSRYPAVRIRRSKRSAADASRLSPRFPGKRFSREIHRRSARYRQYGNFPVGRMNKKEALLRISPFLAARQHTMIKTFRSGRFHHLSAMALSRYDLIEGVGAG
jgi:hypothetical protein